MNQPLTGIAAILQRKIDRLRQRWELLPRFEGTEFDRMRAERHEEIEALENDLRAEVESRRVVLLGVAHALQDVGHGMNEEYGKRLSFLAENYGATILLEEWAYDRPASFACRFAEGRMKYEDVGAPAESEFKTFANAPITYPGHDGTLGPCPDAPSLMEYGPVDVQERREQWMVEILDKVMQDHSVGLFVLGLAHLHSMVMKLRARQYRVSAYTWLG
jgi:hypothetical protein